MAKGLRSSVKKANRSRLRSKVFGPVEEARKQRLSAKLLSKAVEPSPNAKEDTMLLDDSTILSVKSNTTAADHNSSLRTESMNGENEGTRSIHKGGTVDDHNLPFLPGHASFTADQAQFAQHAPFDKVVFMVVDALRRSETFSSPMELLWLSGTVTSSFRITQASSLLRSTCAVRPFAPNVVSQLPQVNQIWVRHTVHRARKRSNNNNAAHQGHYDWFNPFFPRRHLEFRRGG
ncbi:MAG: hypothetical protein Q9171_001234 [Xanthocarpia ochracea]